MKIKSALICFALLMESIFLTGCNGESGKKDTSLFSLEYDATGEVFIPYDILHGPLHISLYEDHYLIVGNSIHSPMIEVYDMVSKRLLKSFGINGNGRDELLALRYLQADPDKNSLYAFDNFQHRLLCYDFQQVLTGPLVKPEQIYQRPEGARSSLNIDNLVEQIMNAHDRYIAHSLFEQVGVLESCLIAESRDSRGRMALIDFNGDIIGHFLDFPDKSLTNKDLADFAHARLYSSSITMNPAKNRIALTTSSGGLIDLVNLKDSVLESYWSYEIFHPTGFTVTNIGDDVVAQFTDNSIYGFPGICSTEKYVYALFSGKRFEDEMSPYGQQIYVVSWNGEETYKINLDSQINRLAVDSKDRYIYGISIDMDILRFEIVK